MADTPENGWQPPKDWLGELAGSAQESKQRIAGANKTRRDAGKAPQSRILSVKDIQKGKWDADRVLRTTLGGVLREITADDLRAFQQNIATTKTRFTGGMTAQQIINNALEIDRTRANEQIRFAVPVSASKGKVRFITNAGPESKDTRHHVQVEFMDYDREAASADTNARQSALKLKRSPLKIECDCGRWRFWYKYIATIGGFNTGTPETGFPKIRNPHLTGVACKHLLRVMHEIQNGGATIAFLANHIEKGKAHDENKARTKLSQEQADKQVKNLGRRTSEKHTVKVVEAIIKAAKTTPKPKKKAARTQQAVDYAAMRAMLKSMGQSDAQIDAMIAASKANEGN